MINAEGCPGGVASPGAVQNWSPYVGRTVARLPAALSEHSQHVDGRRVLVMSYLFPPSLEMGAQACAQIVRYLPHYGWMPIVLTARERDLEHTQSQAEVTLGGPVIQTAVIPHPCLIYRRLKSRLRPGAADAADESAADGRDSECGFLYQVVSMLVVPDAYTGWIPPAIMAGLQAVRRYRIDHLFSSGPPWTSHLVGLILARLTGLPWTALFRDPWIGPRSHMAAIKAATDLSVRLEAALEQAVVRRADAVVCVTEEHTALLRRVHTEAPATKFVTIPNGFDGVEWEGIEGEDHSDERPGVHPFVVTHAGTFYRHRNPAPFFRALKALIDAGEIARDKIRVDLLGAVDVTGGLHLSQLAAEFGLGSRVHLTRLLGRRDALRRMMRSDLLLLLAGGTLQVPGKTYEYLRAGPPILAIAPAEARAVSRLLRRTGGAWVVEPTDHVGLTRALREAYRSWTEGRDLPAPDPAVVATFDRRLLAGRFAALFAERSFGLLSAHDGTPSGQRELKT